MKAYFYSDTKSNELQDRYTVYEVEVIEGNFDIAERRCRTIARKKNDKLAGGFFNDKCLPYNFKTHYTIIIVPRKTRVTSYNKQDKFIIALIEAEAK